MTRMQSEYFPAPRWVCILAKSRSLFVGKADCVYCSAKCSALEALKLTQANHCVQNCWKVLNDLVAELVSHYVW